MVDMGNFSIAGNMTALYLLIADLQQLVIGAIFLYSGAYKTFSKRSKKTIIHTALPLLFKKEQTAQTVYQIIGVVELIIGLLLLIPAHRAWEIWIASGLATTFVGYLLVSKKIAPDRSCGCLGESMSPISWRTLARALFLLIITVVGWSAHNNWLTSTVGNPWILSLVSVEALFFILLSPELDWAWSRRLTAFGLLRNSSIIETNCANITVELGESIAQMRASFAYMTLVEFIKSDLLEHWREDCWRYLCFAAEFEGHQATVIFAVPILMQPYRVRAAVVDDSSDIVLYNMIPTIEGRSLLTEAYQKDPLTGRA